MTGLPHRHHEQLIFMMSMVFRPLLSTSSTVGTECGVTADLPHEIRGPHHRRFCQPSQAARPRAHRLQGR